MVRRRSCVVKEGVRKVELEERRMEDGGWRKEDGRWKIEDGWRQQLGDDGGRAVDTLELVQ